LVEAVDVGLHLLDECVIYFEGSDCVHARLGLIEVGENW